MYLIRRTTQSTLRASRQPCSILNASLISRSFSSTNTLSRGALPVYLESSTPELTTLLRELNAKILAPQHYTKEQAALVFKSSNKAKLEAEPVEITLGDVTLPLVHIDRNKDVPKHWTTFSSIVDGSETPQDFENALRMLEGFHNAGIKVNVGWQSKLVRKLSIAGMQGTIIKMLQRGKATGVSLREQQVVMMVLSSIYGQAASGDWAKDVTTRAYKYAVQVVEMMDDSVHHGNVTKGAERDDYRGDPRVVAVPTGLAAALAKVHGGDKEQVKKLASRLVSALQQDDFDTQLSTHKSKSQAQETDFSNGKKHVAALSDVIRGIIEFIPVWHALKTSREALGSDMPNATIAKNYEDKALDAIKNGLRESERLQKRGGEVLRYGAIGVARELVEKCQ